MDFARPHVNEACATSRSNIRTLPTSPKITPNSIDAHQISAANLATTSLFQSTTHTDCSLYPDRMIPRTPLVTTKSLVVIMEAFDNLTFAYVTPGEVFQNRNGRFHHEDFLDKPFGSQIRSRNNEGCGFVYVMRPTAELWARSLNHRTQIVHELDASFVCFKLELRPGAVVLESGTGSGAMSHALLRCIAPVGKLHTYEFNKSRVESAREEFKKNQVDKLVTVHHRDVCGKDGGEGGFGLGGNVADAIFLDLPEPWTAVPHAAFAIKPNGRLATYSPCMEQTQKTVKSMRKCGFHSLLTVEVRQREYYVDEVEVETPPTKILVLGESAAARTDDAEKNGGNKATDETEEESNRQQRNGKVTESDKQDNTDVTSESDTKKRKRICARPFSMMRGHSAFLTFATAGLKDQPDPALN